MRLWQAIFIAMLAARLSDLAARNEPFWRDMAEFGSLLCIYSVLWFVGVKVLDPLLKLRGEEL